MRDGAERHAGDGEVWHDATWNSAALPAQYKAAASVFAATGEMDLVLEGLSVTGQVRRTLFRVAFRSIFYLAMLLFVASLLLAFFSEAIDPTIKVFRADLSLAPSPLAPLRNAPILASSMVAYFSLGFVAILILMLAGGTSRIASWLGGRGYRTNCETAMVLRIAGRLVEYGFAADEAVELASRLVGATDASERIAMATTTGSDKSGEASRQMDNARYFQYAAESQIETLRVLVPVLLVAGIGGGATLVYSVALFSPLVSLLYDLSIPTGAY
jgi:hypothetical protein